MLHVNAETSDRLPLLSPDALREDQRQVYDAVVGGPRGEQPSFCVVDDAGCLLGPYNAMLHSPAVGMPLQDLGAALRFRTEFTRREREIAILLVAARWRSEYEWYAHQRAGRDAGLSESELEAIRVGDEPLLADIRERVIYRAVVALLQAGDLDDAIYTKTVSTLGHAKLIDLVTLVGYYITLALQLRVFRVGVPAGESVPSWE